jgi:uncharacterized protein (DUF1697 family)
VTSITGYAALLRGVNVGGNKKVPAAELRQVVESLGHTSVRTYLNSGNAVFSAPDRDEGALAGQLEEALVAHFGFTVPCLVRSGAYLRRVVADNPYPEAAAEGRTLHVTFLSGPPLPERFATLDAAAFLPERFHLGDRVLYLHLPDGIGRSKLAQAISRPALLKGVTPTTRNWNTVQALAELTP